MAANLTLLQKRVTKVLNRIITSGKIANAYIFSGAEGVGKKKFAKAFIKTVNCDQSDQLQEECSCKSCSAVDNNQSADFIDVYPDGTRIKVAQIRDLKSITKYGSATGKWMFVVINDAETMTLEAANSFLKLLEEPSQNVSFILLLKNEDSVLKTIRSRSQLIVFSQLNPEYLINTIDSPDMNLIDIVKGEKNVYDFVQNENVRPLIEQAENVNMKTNKYDLLLLAEKLSSFSKLEIKYFINYLMMKEILAITTGQDSDLIAKKIQVIKKCHETLKKIDYNISLKLHVESLLLNLAAVG